jgi:hypothetical protein
MREIPPCLWPPALFEYDFRVTSVIGCEYGSSDFFQIKGRRMAMRSTNAVAQDTTRLTHSYHIFCVFDIKSSTAHSHCNQDLQSGGGLRYAKSVDLVHELADMA